MQQTNVYSDFGCRKLHFNKHFRKMKGAQNYIGIFFFYSTGLPGYHATQRRTDRIKKSAGNKFKKQLETTRERNKNMPTPINIYKSGRTSNCYSIIYLLEIGSGGAAGNSPGRANSTRSTGNCRSLLRLNAKKEERWAPPLAPTVPLADYFFPFSGKAERKQTRI